VFDPFKDFESSGYLRNTHQVKDSEVVKRIEHDLFLANLPDALKFLSLKKQITYADFLRVHMILFSAFYPWAGKDRSVTAPDIAVSKTGILFSHPRDAQRAVIEGLRIGQLKEQMNLTPGLVMGFFAYGHPFLDGNGRTMLVVHSELCYRAGFSINWGLTVKADYLAALSEEIKKPGNGSLDGYLLQFKEKRLERDDWSKSIVSIRGLNGLDDSTKIEGEFSNELIAEKYQVFEKQRGYKIEP
jgi:cell filamentation protein